MKVIVRLRSPHDIDLIELLYRDDYPFQEMMKKAIYAEARHLPDKIPVPDSFVPSVYTRKNPHVIAVIIDDDDRDVIQFIRNIRPGYRCALIKSIFINRMDHPYLIPTRGALAEKNTDTHPQDNDRRSTTSAIMQHQEKPEYGRTFLKENNKERTLPPMQEKQASLYHNEQDLQESNNSEKEILGEEESPFDFISSLMH